VIAASDDEASDDEASDDEASDDEASDDEASDDADMPVPIGPSRSSYSPLFWISLHLNTSGALKSPDSYNYCANNLLFLTRLPCYPLWEVYNILLP
jgi:hypothetical protein